MKHMECGLIKTTSKDIKSIAAHLVKQNKKLFKDATHLLKRADAGRTPGFLEKMLAMKEERDQSRREKEGEPARDPKTSLKMSVLVVSRLLGHCLRNPDADPGIPAISDIVWKLRAVKELGSTKLFDLELTATDYMSIVINARGDGS